jgi:hypothetical protein
LHCSRLTTPFPPGYEEALYSNLAIRLAADGFGELTPALAALANESLGRIKGANLFPVKDEVRSRNSPHLIAQWTSTQATNANSATSQRK